MKFIILISSVLILSLSLLAAQRLVDNVDGTVKDTKTYFIWQKCSAGQNAFDCSGTAEVLDWEGAIDQCNNLTLAEKKWRLPKSEELLSLVNFSYKAPAINATYFPNTKASNYWSSSSGGKNADYAWAVSFVLGGEGPSNRTSRYYVRCVVDGM